MALGLSCAWLLLVVWLLARAFRQTSALPSIKPAGEPAAAPRVAVIIPMRNEEADVARCLLPLLEQSYPRGLLQLLVVDDHSSDRTLSMARSFAAEHPNLTVMQAPPLPPGWTGKSHACWIAARAVPADIEWLCFIDADVRAEKDLMASAVATACSHRLALLSLSARQLLGSFAERLVMPCGFYLLAFFQDLHALQSAAEDQVTVSGKFMLINRRCYDEVGGHAAVRDAICEDAVLAGRIKRAGGHVVLEDGGGLLATRMYVGWRTLWLGVSKNLVEMFGGPRSTVLVALAAIIVPWAAWLVPAIDAVQCADNASGACFALGPALLASAAALAFHIVGAWHFRIPLWYGVLFPLGYTAGGLIALDSVRRRMRGRIVWKDRTYP